MAEIQSREGLPPAAASLPPRKACCRLLPLILPLRKACCLPPLPLILPPRKACCLPLPSIPSPRKIYFLPLPLIHLLSKDFSPRVAPPTVRIDPIPVPLPKKAPIPSYIFSCISPFPAFLLNHFIPTLDKESFFYFTFLFFAAQAILT